jgi:hypothetical protein
MNKGPPAFARQRSATTECLEGALAVENPILDFSATLAKPAVVRVDAAALRAHMAGAIAMLARMDAELVKPAPAPVPAQPAPADGLKTQAQAARRLNISIRTLRGLVSAGDLRYVNVGHGKEREKMMFTDNDLNDLIASRTRQKAQQCQSISPRARRSTTSTSSGEVIAFTARRNGRTGAKRKR